MKPYGIPRDIDVEHPDIAASKEFALKPSKVNIKSQGGDFRDPNRSTQAKAATRRIWKKQERLKMHNALQKNVDAYMLQRNENESS